MSSVCKCPGCGVELEYTADMSGATVECSACNTQFILPDAEVKQMAPDETKCQACGNIIKRKAKVCRFCKTRQAIYCQCSCPECGETFKIDYEDQGEQIQCPMCGLSVEPVMLEEVVHCIQCECDFTIQASQLGKTQPCPYCNAMIPTNRKKLNLQIVGHERTKKTAATTQSRQQEVEQQYTCEKPILQAAPSTKSSSGCLIWAIASIILLAIIGIPIGAVAFNALNAARSRAINTNCISRLKSFGLSCYLYTTVNRDHLPENLQQLIAGGHMGTTDAEKVKLSITCPANKQEYIYLGKGFVIEKDYGNIPLAIDRPGNHKKAGNCINIVFLDGHLASKTLPDHVKTINDVIDFLASEDPKITSSAIARLKANAAQYKDITITSKPVRKNLLARLTNSSADDYNKGVEYAEKSDYTNAVYWYRKAAEQGHAAAQNNLGHCYGYGKGVEQSYYEAVKWYRKAAEQGVALAQYNLGLCYYNGKGVEQSFYEATKWLRKAAEQGHAAAQYNLGYCYGYGKGVEQSYYEAVNWYRKAAEQGDAAAQHNLGVCYYNGRGVEQSFYEATKWFRKAAEQGDAAAQNNLGTCYGNGSGVEQSYYEAVNWYRKAAEQGDAEAQNNLGVCYYYGKGVEQSYYEAVIWYRKAAEQGFANAQNSLGVCYENGSGVERSFYEAVNWYRKAAEQGVALAQYNLAECYYNGKGVEQSFYEATKWFRKAAEQGLAVAQHDLGYCYYLGEGVSEDNNSAFYWFSKAAAQNNASAQYFLGECYKNGYGTNKNLSQAFLHYTLAATRGNIPALRELGKCYTHGWGVNQNMEKARLYLEKAANNNDSEAQYYMGMYWAAQGNNSNAAHWYQKAAQQGHKQAREELNKLQY